MFGSEVSRRSVLMAAVALGLVQVVGVGCGEDETLPTDQDPRKLGGDRDTERLNFHFDLSHIPELLGGVLHIGPREIPLDEHSAESREAHRQVHPALRDIPDQKLTHYVAGVEMFGDAMQTIFVTHTMVRDGRPQRGLAMAAIHVPSTSLKAARGRFQDRGKHVHLGLLDALPTGGIRVMDDPAPNEDPALDTPDARLLGSQDAAKAILFHHPDILNLDPDVGAHLMAHIEDAEGYDYFWNSIAQQGAAYEHEEPYPDGWAVLDPIFLDDGVTRRQDSSGNDMYSYRLSDQTLEDMNTALKSLLVNTKDDAYLKGISYRVTDGNPSVDLTDGATTSSMHTLSGGYGVAFDEAQDLAGLEMGVTLTAAATRTVTLSLKNYWLRSLHYCVQYLDVTGNPILIPDDQKSDSDPDDYTRSLDTVGGPPTILAIPLPADVNTYDLALPPAATQVLLLAGGLGTGQLDPYRGVAKSGIISTLVFDYGIPVFLLAAGSYIKSTEPIKKLMKDKELMLAIGAVATFLAAPEVAVETNARGSAKVPLARLGNLVAGILWGAGVGALKDWVMGQITEATAEKATGFIGWCAWVLGNAATFAQLTETTVEVLSSPFIIQNTVSVTMDIQVTLHPDTQDTHFPEVATYFVVKAVFSDKTPRTKRVELPPTTVSDPLVVTLEAVPAGGTVKVSVGFYSDTNWLAGNAESEVLTNLVPDGADKLAIDLTITERKVPLTPSTQYSHKEKLIYADGRHQWLASAAPAAVLGALACDDTGNKLCELHSITFSQLTGMLGYSWRSSSSAVIDCSTQITNTQTYQLQNIFSGATPDDALKTLTYTDPGGTDRPCGFRSASHMVYDLMGPKDGMGNNFYVDATDDGFHLRRIVLDKTRGKLNRATGQSFGRFSQRLDSMVLHPSGYVIGASWSRHKIEVLAVSSVPYDDDQAPMARVLAGRGVREGLLYGPRAVAMTSDGAILVLESLNKRIQALSINGDPIPRFGPNGDQYFVPLKDAESDAVEYLDLGVEFEGYLYVLSYLTTSKGDPNAYRLDIYSPRGEFLSRTTGVTAARLVVDLWRTMYTLGFGLLAGPQGRIEPVVSEWIPSTPAGEAP